MFRQLLAGMAAVLWLAPVNAQSDDKRTEAEVWVAGYQKLGGKAGLSASAHDEPTLSIEKRMGQKPLVSLKGLKPATGIRAIALQGYEVDDEDLEALAGWKELEVIQVVDGKRVTDTGVRAIARLPRLRRVDLVDTAVTGTGLSAFSGHPTLTNLTLSNTIVKTRVRSLELKDLPALATLTLSAEGITSIRLAKMPRLRELTDFPLAVERAELSDLGELTELDFHGSKLEKLSLSGMPKLESLDVRETQLKDSAVADLKRLYPSVTIRK